MSDQSDKPSREEAPGRGRGAAAERGFEQGQQDRIDQLEQRVADLENANTEPGDTEGTV